MSLFDELSDPRQAAEARSDLLRRGANTRRWSNIQHGTVYTRPIPMNSEDADILVSAARNPGTMRQANINDVFRFRLKLDPEPGTRLAADEAYPNADAIPLSSSPVWAALRLSMLPTAISRKGYTGKFPKIGDKVTVECFYALHTDSDEPSLESVIFKQIDNDEITPASLHQPAPEGDIEGELNALYSGDWTPATPKVATTPKVAASPAPTTPTPSGSSTSPAPPGVHPTSNLSSIISTAPVNEKTVKIRWEQAAILYANGLGDLLGYASAHEGGYNSVVGHGRAPGDHRGFWTAGGSKKIKAKLEGFPENYTLTDFTLREIRDIVHPFMNSQRKAKAIESTAIGGYQILMSTFCCKPSSALGQLKEVHTEAEFEAILDLKFDADTQNRLGILLAVGKRPILGNYVLGFHNNYTEAGNDFAKEWASIPLQTDWTYKGNTCKRGQSAYCGVGSNATRGDRTNEVGVQKVINKLDATRAKVSRFANSSLASFFADNAATHTRQPSDEPLYVNMVQSTTIAAMEASMTAADPDFAVQTAVNAALMQAGIHPLGTNSGDIDLADLAIMSALNAGAGMMSPYSTSSIKMDSPSLSSSDGWIGKVSLTTDTSADLGTRENPGTYGVDWISVRNGHRWAQKSLHTEEFWPSDSDSSGEDIAAAFNVGGN